MLIIQNHRTASVTIQQYNKDAVIIDVTSRGAEPWVRFSPFYPHGGIPVPFSPGITSASVEGIWQGLKVFEHADVDPIKFKIDAMKNLKRTTRTYGRVQGHRAGVTGERLLAYIEARYLIYLPTYHWVLEHCLQAQIAELKNLEQTQTVVLLDYDTNCDLNNPKTPLSHAGLIKRYIEGAWPASAKS